MFIFANCFIKLTKTFISFIKQRERRGVLVPISITLSFFFAGSSPLCVVAVMRLIYTVKLSSVHLTEIAQLLTKNFLEFTTFKKTRLILKLHATLKTFQAINSRICHSPVKRSTGQRFRHALNTLKTGHTLLLILPRRS